MDEEASLAAGSSMSAYALDDDDDDDDGDDDDDDGLNAALRRAAAQNDLRPHPKASFLEPRNDHERSVIRRRADLGRFLFFDHVLSGVEQTSCGTCHHAAFQFGDGRNIARGVFCNLNDDFSQIFCEEPPAPGVGGNVIGPDRTSPLNSRNTPSVFNTALFPAQMWNGRFHFVDDSSIDVNELDRSLGFQFPAPENVLFTRSLLTAQAHIPVTEAVEMTGDFPRFGEPFPVPDIRNEEVRTTLADIVSGIDAYRALFEAAYAPGTSLTDRDPVVEPGNPVPYLAIADAMAHFQEHDLTMTDAPWDRFLAGNSGAMSNAAKRGALIFMGRGKCISCHTGDLFSDFANYNIGTPQVGPGTAQSDDSDPSYQGLATWDFGLQEITGRRGDRFKFRTPPLRGVALTSPYMHAGQFATIEGAIAHHLNPRRSYTRYDISQIEPDMQAADGLKPIGPVFSRKNPVVMGPDTELDVRLTSRDIALVIEFLKALTDPRMNDTAALAPAELPSGLPADVAGPRRFPLYR